MPTQLEASPEIGSPATHGYVSVKIRARGLQVLFILMAFASLGLALCSFAELKLGRGVLGGGYVYRTGPPQYVRQFDAQGNLTFKQVYPEGSWMVHPKLRWAASVRQFVRQYTWPIRVLFILFVISWWICFLMWLYRVHRNLIALGGPVPNWTPGWTVGGFFLPLVNLLWPFIAITMISQCSSGDRETRPTVKGKGNPGLLGGLWAKGWLVQLVLTPVLLWKVWTVRPWSLPPHELGMVVHLVWAAWYVLGILSVESIQTWQEARARPMAGAVSP